MQNTNLENVPLPLQKFVEFAIKTKKAFISIACLIMGLTFMLVVIMRYIFESDLFAYEEWLLTICFWLYFMGSAVGTHEGTQVSADLMDQILTDPRKIWLRNVTVQTIELVVTVALVYWSILMLRDEIASYPYWQTTIALKIPFLVPRTAVFLGFLFMGFYTAIHLYVLLKEGPETQTTDNGGAA